MARREATNVTKGDHDKAVRNKPYFVFLSLRLNSALGFLDISKSKIGSASCAS